MGQKVFYPLEIEQRQNFKSQLREIVLPSHSVVDGKALVELNLPTDSLIILISRDDQFIMPNGSTEIFSNDKLLVLANTMSDLDGVYHRLGIEIPETT